MEKEFLEARKKYEKIREQERRDLIEFLEQTFQDEVRIKIIKGGKSGKGAKDYSSGGRLGEASYDLSNWKWVEVTDRLQKQNTCIISLNMLEQDPRSGNIHALYDRIGFFISLCSPDSPLLVKEVRLITSLELPLNETKKKQIKEILAKEFIQNLNQ